MKIFLNPYQSRYPRSVCSSELARYIISPWAKPQLIRYGHNSILSQKISNQLYSINIFNLQILEKCDLHFKFQNPTFSLQLMTVGKMTYSFPDAGGFNLKPFQNNLVYFPKGSKKVSFGVGSHEFIQIEISPMWINHMIKHYNKVSDSLLELITPTGCFRALSTEDFSESIDFINIMRKRTDKGPDLHFRNVTLVQYLLEQYCNVLHADKILNPSLKSQPNFQFVKNTNHENHYQSKRH